MIHVTPILLVKSFMARYASVIESRAPPRSVLLSFLLDGSDSTLRKLETAQLLDTDRFWRITSASEFASAAGVSDAVAQSLAAAQNELRSEQWHLLSGECVTLLGTLWRSSRLFLEMASQGRGGGHYDDYGDGYDDSWKDDHLLSDDSVLHLPRKKVNNDDSSSPSSFLFRSCCDDQSNKKNQNNGVGAILKVRPRSEESLVCWCQFVNMLLQQQRKQLSEITASVVVVNKKSCQQQEQELHQALLETASVVASPQTVRAWCALIVAAVASCCCSSTPSITTTTTTIIRGSQALCIKLTSPSFTRHVTSAEAVHAYSRALASLFAGLPTSVNAKHIDVKGLRGAMLTVAPAGITTAVACHAFCVMIWELCRCLPQLCRALRDSEVRDMLVTLLEQHATTSHSAGWVANAVRVVVHGSEDAERLFGSANSRMRDALMKRACLLDDVNDIRSWCSCLACFAVEERSCALCAGQEMFRVLLHVGSKIVELDPRHHHPAATHPAGGHENISADEMSEEEELEKSETSSSSSSASASSARWFCSVVARFASRSTVMLKLFGASAEFRDLLIDLQPIACRTTAGTASWTNAIRFIVRVIDSSNNSRRTCEDPSPLLHPSETPVRCYGCHPGMRDALVASMITKTGSRCSDADCRRNFVSALSNFSRDDAARRVLFEDSYSTSDEKNRITLLDIIIAEGFLYYNRSSNSRYDSESLMWTAAALSNLTKDPVTCHQLDLLLLGDINSEKKHHQSSSSSSNFCTALLGLLERSVNEMSKMAMEAVEEEEEGAPSVATDIHQAEQQHASVIVWICSSIANILHHHHSTTSSSTTCGTRVTAKSWCVAFFGSEKVRDVLVSVAQQFLVRLERRNSNSNSNISAFKLLTWLRVVHAITKTNDPTIKLRYATKEIYTALIMLEAHHLEREKQSRRCRNKSTSDALIASNEIFETPPPAHDRIVWTCVVNNIVAVDDADMRRRWGSEEMRDILLSLPKVFEGNEAVTRWLGIICSLTRRDTGIKVRFGTREMRDVLAGQIFPLVKSRTSLVLFLGVISSLTWLNKVTQRVFFVDGDAESSSRMVTMMDVLCSLAPRISQQTILHYVRALANSVSAPDAGTREKFCCVPVRDALFTVHKLCVTPETVRWWTACVNSICLATRTGRKGRRLFATLEMHDCVVNVLQRHATTDDSAKNLCAMLAALTRRPLQQMSSCQPHVEGDDGDEQEDAVVVFDFSTEEMRAVLVNISKFLVASSLSAHWFCSVLLNCGRNKSRRFATKEIEAALIALHPLASQSETAMSLWRRVVLNFAFADAKLLLVGNNLGRHRI